MAMMTRDGKLYRELSEPFESPDEANAAIEAFIKDLAEIRKKHGLRDVLCVISSACTYPDGEEADFIMSYQLGDEAKGVLLAAWIYGEAQAEHREMVNKASSRSGTRKKSSESP